MNKIIDRMNERYSRQIALREIGVSGQRKLAASSVLVIGAGGLGSPACLYLAAAGVGTIGLVDDDKVEVSNLQRQVMHTTGSVGKPKVQSAAAALKSLNPGVKIRCHQERFTVSNAARLLGPYDFIIDATDNLASKFLVAEACHALAKPYSHAGISEFTGQTMTVVPGRTCCYSCVFHPVPRPTGSTARPRGPFGAVPGVIGSVQAMEAIKQILGIGTLLTNRLLVFDALQATFRVVTFKRNPNCHVCGRKRK
ncbi:MAG: HesA/MoeB/ThiF family protein [bacterium]